MSPIRRLLTTAIAAAAAVAALGTAHTRARASDGGAPAWPLAAPASCDSLSSLKLPHTTITNAALVEAGKFSPPSPPGGAPPAGSMFASLPAFCRVAATLAPSSDSDVKIEVWMPASAWNGKFEGVGNGGWSGNIVYQGLAAQLARGYATASTDTGHVGPRAEFALGHPEKLTDFAWRAVHEMTVQAKAIVAEYYGSKAHLSYWNGCSSGGKQGLKEAQKFPDDYDGIIAGAPANNWTHLEAQAIWIAQATLGDPASHIPPEKFPAISKAALDACDALDGVTDGLISDPERCHFDPKAMECAGQDGPTCLTRPQVDAARKIYAPLKSPRTGATIYPGLAPGSETGWGPLAGGPQPFVIATDHFKYVVFKDPAWDFKTFDVDKDVAAADRIDGGSINATDPNVNAFFSRGGKILMYHGWIDQLISPYNSVDYYNSVAAAIGGRAKAAESIRLFMVPGMAHCAGGPGATSADYVGALEAWVEQKKAPDRIVAAHLTGGKPDRTRPLCPYPQRATYSGTGNSDDAASFVCKAR